MQNELGDEEILALSRSVVIREEGDRVLLFNSISDEMHLVSREGLGIIRLCSHSLTVGQIEKLVVVRNDGAEEGSDPQTIRRFLRALVDRGILTSSRPAAVAYGDARLTSCGDRTGDPAPHLGRPEGGA